MRMGSLALLACALLAGTAGTACAQSTGLGTCQDLAMSRHNELRAVHNAPAVEWDDKLAQDAQEWANQLAQNSPQAGSDICNRTSSGMQGYGENIHACHKLVKDPLFGGRDVPGQCGTCGSAVDEWYGEFNSFGYKFTQAPSQQNNLEMVSHFSQVVWAGAKKLGCGAAVGQGGCSVFVCRYSPAGNENVEGESKDQAYVKNVLPPKDANGKTDFPGWFNTFTADGAATSNAGTSTGMSGSGDSTGSSGLGGDAMPHLTTSASERGMPVDGSLPGSGDPMGTQDTKPDPFLWEVPPHEPPRFGARQHSYQYSADTNAGQYGQGPSGDQTGPSYRDIRYDNGQHGSWPSNGENRINVPGGYGNNVDPGYEANARFQPDEQRNGRNDYSRTDSHSNEDIFNHADINQRNIYSGNGYNQHNSIPDDHYNHPGSNGRPDRFDGYNSIPVNDYNYPGNHGRPASYGGSGSEGNMYRGGPGYMPDDNGMRHDNGRQYDSGRLYDNGMQYDNGRHDSNGRQYDNGMQYGNGRPYGSGGHYDNGMQYGNGRHYSNDRRGDGSQSGGYLPGSYGMHGNDGMPDNNGYPSSHGMPGSNGQTSGHGNNEQHGMHGSNGMPGADNAPGNPGTPGDNGMPDSSGQHGSNDMPGADNMPGTHDNSGRPGDNGMHGSNGRHGSNGQPDSFNVPGNNGRLDHSGVQASDQGTPGGGSSTGSGTPHQPTDSNNHGNQPLNSTVPTQQQSSGGSDSGNHGDCMSALAVHNKYRARHNATAMTWDSELVAGAQKWANELASRGCSLDHSPQDPKSPREARHGEMLYTCWRAQGACSDCSTASEWFYSEAKNYNFTDKPWQDNKANFVKVGHFTQMVWKKSTKLGCALAVGSNNCHITVCWYKEAGNWEGDKEFLENVSKPVQGATDSSATGTKN